MYNQLNLPQVDSNQVVETLKDDQWKQDAPELNFKSHSKGSEYLCKYVFFCFFKTHFQIKHLTCFCFVIMGKCGMYFLNALYLSIKQLSELHAQEVTGSMHFIHCLPCRQNKTGLGGLLEIVLAY